MEHLTEGNYISSDSVKDSWGNNYRFEGGGDTRPVITGAGPDGQFDTEDDIHSKDNNE